MATIDSQRTGGRLLEESSSSPGDRARQEVETAARWTAFTDELRTMLAAAVQADGIRRKSVNLAALQTYNLCKQLVRDKTRAPQVTAHLQEMKRLNKLGRRSKPSTGSPQPEPTPAPTPPITIPQ